MPLDGGDVEDCWVVRIGNADFDLVKIGGSLDRDCVARVARELAGSAGRPLIVDLAHCTFIDPRGLDLLVGACLDAGSDPTSICVIGARGAVERMIEFADVHRRIPRFRDLDSARAAMRSEPTLILSQPARRTGSPLSLRARST
jgi:anti-anti-sigma factor